MARPICALIDCEAARYNLQRIRVMAPQSKIMAVVKANAYGHGIELMAPCLSQADAFAVASVDEALALRQLGVSHPIVLLEGIFCASELADVVKHRLELVLHSDEQIAMLKTHQGCNNLVIWIKVDTGMHRLGFAPSEVARVWHQVQGLSCLAQPLRLMTHFASSDEPDSPVNAQQLAQFMHLLSSLPDPLAVSLSNSAAIVHLPESHGDWIRPGLMIYGVSPSVMSIEALDIKPVMTLVTRVIAVKTVTAGESVGYGGSWQATQTTQLAIIAAGYGDGYPRHVPSGTLVLVNGRQAPIVGRVSMDMISVDVSHLDQVDVGDPVVLWGKGLPIEHLAQAANTISYELLCGVTKRVPSLLKAADQSWYEKPERSTHEVY
ncbi:MAG: alanine racemase [Gammaproteobacteria bacterium]|nr:alanine racemase [Gammaproteobacteria bacterium]